LSQPPGSNQPEIGFFTDDWGKVVRIANIAPQ
jgi:hypothetical protein